MDSLSTNQIKTAAFVGGPRLTSASPGPAKTETRPEPAATPASPAPSLPVKDNGVTTLITSEGYRSQTADTGLTVLTSEQAQEIRLPTGQAFRLTEDGVSALNQETGSGATLSRTEENLLLLSFQDHDGNTVRVQPESMTYEVLNKQKNLAQVFHPDGHQEVVAFGKFRHGDGSVVDYEHRLLYGGDGQLVGAEGFDGLAVEGRKLSFDLAPGVRSERTLAKPLPGQPAFEESAVASTAQHTAAPMALLGEEPPLVEPSVAQPATHTTSNLTSEAVSVFPDLTDIGSDFFAGAGAANVVFDEAPSGLVMRQEGDTRAFLLPNGDAFRTDGQKVELLGETPRAKNVRVVDEGESQLLAYSDEDGNRHTLDINTGDYEVSNRQGTLTQGLKVDGTKEYGVRGTYTSDAGKPVQYHHTARFSETGTLLSKDGFDDLRISGSQMSFTLPNGVETDRTLITAAEHEVSIPKKLVVTGGVADEWGSALSLADELLNPTAPPAAAAPGTPISGVNNDQGATGTQALGLVRIPLEDGSGGSVSILPNGIRITDGYELSATDAEGNPIPVTQTFATQYSEPIELPVEGEDPLDAIATSTPEPSGSYWLTVAGPDGESYTVADNSLDLIVQSADGKIHQLVAPGGKVLTNIKDGENQHLIEFNPTGKSTATPGTRLDPQQPDTVFVDGPQGSRSYKVPHAFGQPPQGQPGPTGPTVGTPGFASMPPQDGAWGQPEGQPFAPIDHGYTAGPGGIAEGFQPNFWQRLKGAFTNENPWDTNPLGQGGFDQSALYRPAPYPVGYAQYQPILAQMEQMNQMNQMMLWSQMGMTMMSQMSGAMMFYSPMGMFW